MITQKNYYKVPESKWGHAITYTYEKEDGTMWVGNDEYESQVNFCPITGKPATKQINKVSESQLTVLDGRMISYYE